MPRWAPLALLFFVVVVEEVYQPVGIEREDGRNATQRNQVRSERMGTWMMVMMMVR